MRLNRRVPVGTHGGVRGRLPIYGSLLLDCDLIFELGVDIILPNQDLLNHD